MDKKPDLACDLILALLNAVVDKLKEDQLKDSIKPTTVIPET